MGASVWDGTLSLDGFNASAKALITKWREVDVEDCLPDWTWKPCWTMGLPPQVEGFLALEGVYHTGARSQIEDINNLGDEGTLEHDTWVQTSSDSVHVYDFHIAYSFSYKVPLLYFQGHQAGAPPPK